MAARADATRAYTSPLCRFVVRYRGIVRQTNNGELGCADTRISREAAETLAVAAVTVAATATATARSLAHPPRSLARLLRCVNNVDVKAMYDTYGNVSDLVHRSCISRSDSAAITRPCPLSKSQLRSLARSSLRAMHGISISAADDALPIVFPLLFLPPSPPPPRFSVESCQERARNILVSRVSKENRRVSLYLPLLPPSPLSPLLPPSCPPLLAPPS